MNTVSVKEVPDSNIATNQTDSPQNETRSSEESRFSLADKARLGLSVAYELYDEARARLDETVSELNKELTRRNPESKLDAGWQVAEEAFNATRKGFENAIQDFRSELERLDDEGASFVDKTKLFAEAGYSLSKEQLEVAKQEFEKASADLRERIEAKTREQAHEGTKPTMEEHNTHEGRI